MRIQIPNTGYKEKHGRECMNLDEMLQLPEEDGVNDILVLAPPCPASAPRLVPLIVLRLGLKKKRIRIFNTCTMQLHTVHYGSKRKSK
jgi:hypothetical protein